METYTLLFPMTHPPGTSQPPVVKASAFPRRNMTHVHGVDTYRARPERAFSTTHDWLWECLTCIHYPIRLFNRLTWPPPSSLMPCLRSIFPKSKTKTQNQKHRRALFLAAATIYRFRQRLSWACLSWQTVTIEKNSSSFCFQRNTTQKCDDNRSSKYFNPRANIQ